MRRLLYVYGSERTPAGVLFLYVQKKGHDARHPEDAGALFSRVMVWRLNR